jgi:hypothetical protein
MNSQEMGVSHPEFWMESTFVDSTAWEDRTAKGVRRCRPGTWNPDLTLGSA